MWAAAEQEGGPGRGRPSQEPGPSQDKLWAGSCGRGWPLEVEERWGTQAAVLTHPGMARGPVSSPLAPARDPQIWPVTRLGFLRLGCDGAKGQRPVLWGRGSDQEGHFPWGLHPPPAGGLGKGPGGSADLLCHINFGGGLSPELTLGVTLAKKRLFSWGEEGVGWHGNVGADPSPKLAPNPPHTQLAKPSEPRAARSRLPVTLHDDFTVFF